MKQELCDSERREQQLEEQLESKLQEFKDEHEIMDCQIDHKTITISTLTEELQLAEEDKDELRRTVRFC